jgi:Inner membrane component of T3SS, cytoplasmic domain
MMHGTVIRPESEEPSAIGPRDEIIWIEILSRHREVAARFRLAGPEVRIGRGYDNDVVVDDPYVAARHLRLFRDDAGQLVAEDLGSANGMFVGGGRTRLARTPVDGKQPIRIGQTYVRVRDAEHEVEPERVVRPALRTVPIVLAVALLAALFSIDALHVWLTQTSEPKALDYLTPLVWIGVGGFLWVGFWALLSRIFSGRSRFLPNLLIALGGALVYSLYEEFAQFSAFALNWPTAGNYAYIAVWSIVAVVCFFHLREVGPSRLVLKGALVTALFAAVIVVQSLQRSEVLQNSGREISTRQLMPPAFRLVPLRDEAAFFDDIAKVKAKLDADRARVKAEGGER